jgi:serine O-acetyltransferase
MSGLGPRTKTDSIAPAASAKAPGPGAALEPARHMAAVVDALCAPGLSEASRGLRTGPLPSRDVVIAVVEDLRSVLFPGYFGICEASSENVRFHVGATLDHAIRALTEQIRRGLCFACAEVPGDCCAECDHKARRVALDFLDRLPEVQRLLATDVAAAYQGDPAASTPDEAIFCYPGVLAVTSFRLAHELYRLCVPLIPRIITEHAHSLTGIDIHPGARIGAGFFIDHGTGVVIGETAVIGERVRLYQGVTLGAKSLPLDENGNPVKGIARHPIVEDDVVIYSGATILGRVTIGRGAVIGGNVWLTRSVAPGERVTQSLGGEGI